MDHVISVLAWIAVFGVFAGLGVQLFRNARRQKEAQSWPRTEATIQSSEMEWMSHGRGQVERPCFAFSYTVSGEYYSGRFSLWGCNDRYTTLMREMIDTKLSIHYNSAKPEEFVLPESTVEGCRIQKMPD